MLFRYKSSIPVPYERQGYIYFKSLTYFGMAVSDQKRIQSVCQLVCPGNWQALLEHVTTGEPVKEICKRHCIASPTTIYRALRLYYEQFPEDL